MNVSTKAFSGKCEVCGDVAELRTARATALLQNQETHQLSAVDTGLVAGAYCGHVYYVILWDTQVEDPFEEGEDLDTSPLDMELPPPPPKEED